MNDKDMKVAELRGYSRGYVAGKRRKQREISQETIQRKKEAFWQKAFLAAIPSALVAQGWKRGEKPIMELPDRMRLAVDTANEALRQALPHLY